LGLPGASIDGILGFTILARFRLEFDPTSDRMLWTRIDYEPREPFIPRNLRTRNGPKPPAEVRAMEALGPLMKLAAVFVGKQPADRLEHQGLLGIVLDADAAAPGLRVAVVLAGSPAAQAGIRPGDDLVKVLGKDLADQAALEQAIAGMKPGDEVAVVVRRGSDTLELKLRAGEGF
jgi:membrane-associated protease RseP (regulator of RpoE activity)